MFSIRSRVAAGLLLILTKSFAIATLEDDVERVRTLDKKIANLSPISWMNGIDSFTRSTESSCADDVAVVSEAFASRQSWTIQMFDASSKLQSGITQGNFRDLGMYDQCIRVNENYNNSIIQGKHCMVSFGFITSSVCVPSSCNETNVADLVTAAIQNVTGTDQPKLVVSGVSCARVGNGDFTTGEILTIALFSLVGALILFCTACEFATNYSCLKGRSTVLDTLAKFSVHSTGIAIMSTKRSPKIMPAIQGIRFLSMCWVVLGHRYLNSLMKPTVNSIDFVEWTKSWTAVYIQAAPFAVDTFFVVSGFLMSYLYLKSEKSEKLSHFPMMYLHRYLRLTPAIAALMLFLSTLFHRVANGPIWDSSVSLEIDNCRKNWWINLLYVQNFARVESMCIGQSWYLAVDMQLFWISPILLYPLYRWPKVGLGILGLFITGSVVIPAVILALNGYSNAVLRLDRDVDRNRVLDGFTQYYIPTHTRACAYFVGILLGYDLANNKRSPTQTMVAINWVVACIFMLICGLATKYLYDTDIEYNIHFEILFALTLRPFWSIAIAWIVYACTQGYGGPITSFLSLSIFLPLSRLSYCIYLVHMLIQTAKNSVTQIPDRFSDLTMLEHFWDDLVISIVVAFFLSLFFEAPVIVLEKMLKTLGREEKRSTPLPEPIESRRVESIRLKTRQCIYFTQILPAAVQQSRWKENPKIERKDENSRSELRVESI